MYKKKYQNGTSGLAGSAITAGASLLGTAVGGPIGGAIGGAIGQGVNAVMENAKLKKERAVNTARRNNMANLGAQAKMYGAQEPIIDLYKKGTRSMQGPKRLVEIEKGEAVFVPASMNSGINASKASKKDRSVNNWKLLTYLDPRNPKMKKHNKGGHTVELPTGAAIIKSKDAPAAVAAHKTRNWPTLSRIIQNQPKDTVYKEGKVYAKNGLQNLTDPMFNYKVGSGPVAPGASSNSQWSSMQPESPLKNKLKNIMTPSGANNQMGLGGQLLGLARPMYDFARGVAKPDTYTPTYATPQAQRYTDLSAEERQALQSNYRVGLGNTENYAGGNAGAAMANTANMYGQLQQGMANLQTRRMDLYNRIRSSNVDQFNRAAIHNANTATNQSIAAQQDRAAGRNLVSDSLGDMYAQNERNMRLKNLAAEDARKQSLVDRNDRITLEILKSSYPDSGERFSKLIEKYFPW